MAKLLSKFRRKKGVPFKERPIGKVAGIGLNVIGDLAKVPSIKNWFTGEKLAKNWKVIAIVCGASILAAILVKFELIDLDSLILIIEEIFEKAV